MTHYIESHWRTADNSELANSRYYLSYEIQASLAGRYRACWIMALQKLITHTGMFTKIWHISFTIFTEPNIVMLNLRIPNDSAFYGNLFNMHLNYTIPTYQSQQDIFDMAFVSGETRICLPPENLHCFLHVSTDPAHGAALTDLFSCCGGL